MGYVQLILALVKIAQLIGNYVKDKQLIDAGKAIAITEALDDVTAFIEDAHKGAAGMQSGAPDSAWRERVRNKYRSP